MKKAMATVEIHTRLLPENQLSKHRDDIYKHNVLLRVVNIQHTFLIQQHVTHNKYSPRTFGSRNVAKNHVATPSKTERLLVCRQL